MRRFSAYRLIVLATTAASLSACSYSQLVEQEHAVKAEWDQVQTELKRRNDLIPGLVDQVKPFAPNEQPVFQELTDSHARLAAARTPEDTFGAANQQSTALAHLLLSVENFPQLKANVSYNRLMGQLKDAESRVVVSRMQYNARVQQYMTSRRPLGGALTAGVFRFEDYPFFEVPTIGKFPKVQHEQPAEP